MIIRNNFNINKHGFNKQQDYLQEEKKELKNSIDHLDKRFKNKEVDIEKFKKIMGNYASQHEKLNDRINKKY